MQRILFVSEAVTLAQIVRLVRLADALDPSRYEVHFASALFPEHVFGGKSFRRHEIHSLSPEVVEREVARGSRIYGASTLRRYVADDLRVLDAVKPSLVVGDLRWSLTVSAKLAAVPHAALINAYWSPHVERAGWPLPDHPIVRLLGEALAERTFPKALPFVFRHFVAPMNRIRREHGLPPFPDLPELLCAGDHTLYADVPEFVSPVRAPPNHHFLGAVQWAPEVPLPEWWDRLSGRPVVYATLGSSGNLAVLGRVLEAVSALPVDVMLSTAGRVDPKGLPSNVFAARFLPGDLAARRASVVLTNGGSSTGYQALAEGKPVVGLPFNFDAYLAMEVFTRAKAGIALRSTTATAPQIREALQRGLNGELSDGARRLQAALAGYDSAERFRAFVANVVG